MESLSAEILQDICWLALNPEFYLVSKPISTKLLPVQLFEEDVTLLLFCDRLKPEGPWIDLNLFPWRTSPAARCDFKLDQGERTGLQEVILNQSWFTFEKFKHTAARVCEVWVHTHWKVTDMPADEQRALKEYLKEDVLYGGDWSCDLQDDTLVCNGQGRLSIQKLDSPDVLRDRVVDVRAIPLKLLVPPPTSWKERFFFLIQLLTGSRKPAYCPSALRETILSVVLDGNKQWFVDLFNYADEHGVDVSRAELFCEVYSLIIRERSWPMLKQLCEGLLLPTGFLESVLQPDVNQAIKDGDIMGCEFLRWIEEEGWDNIQRGETFCAFAVTRELDRTPLSAFTKPLGTEFGRDQSFAKSRRCSSSMQARFCG